MKTKANFRVVVASVGLLLFTASLFAAQAPRPMDLTLDVPGLDTVVTRYTRHPPGGAVELWTINDGVHRPTLSSEFAPRVIDWLLAHPKP